MSRDSRFVPAELESHGVCDNGLPMGMVGEQHCRRLLMKREELIE